MAIKMLRNLTQNNRFFYMQFRIYKIKSNTKNEKEDRNAYGLKTYDEKINTFIYRLVLRTKIHI